MFLEILLTPLPGSEIYNESKLSRGNQPIALQWQLQSRELKSLVEKMSNGDFVKIYE